MNKANLTDDDMMGLNSIDLIKRDNITTFFHVNFSSDAFDDQVFDNTKFLEKFEVLVTFN